MLYFLYSSPHFFPGTILPLFMDSSSYLVACFFGDYWKSTEFNTHSALLVIIKKNHKDDGTHWEWDVRYLS